MAGRRGGRLMPGELSADSAGVDLDQARRIHALCEEFECRWRKGGRPRIEELIEQAPNGDRPSLLEELLILELELRRAGGERPGLGEYRDRFPKGEGRVEAAFAQAAGASRRSCTTLT